MAQEKPASTSRRSGEFPAAKSQPPATSDVTGKTFADKDSGVAADKLDEDSADQIRKREEWFYKQRSSANGRIPAGARLKAFQHMQRMMESEGKLVRQPGGGYAAVTPQAGTAVGGTWSALGPAPTTGGFFSPVSGRIEAIAVDPSDPTGNTVLIGGAQGGIWRSTDGGTTWTPTGDSNPSLAMGAIAFANPSSPGGAGVVYAGTGEQASVGFDVYYGAGVLRSTDGGQHWTQTCTVASSMCPFIGPYSDFTFGFFSDGGAHISYIAVNPSNPSLVLVGAHIPQASAGPPSLTTGGVYCSDDGGSTWSQIPSVAGEMATFVGFANSTTAYAALGRTSGSLAGAANPNGIYKSINADGGPTKKCSAITFSNLTTNGIGGFPASSMGRVDLGIAPSDATGKTVYASVADASIDPLTGRSRSSRTNLGVFKTVDGGNTWTNTNAPDICRRQCWYDNVVKVDPSNPNIVFFGGGARALFTPPSSITFEWVIRSTDGGATWSPAIPTSLAGGDPTLPHVDEHALAFAKLPNGKVRTYLGNDGGLWRTDDAEAPTVAWTNLNNFPLQLTQFYPSLSIHPSNPSLGFGGTQDNGSQNFTGKPLSPTNDWADNHACGDGGWTVIDPATPSTVYVLCQVFLLKKSVTNGTPFSFRLAVNGIDFTDPVNFIAPMAIDPANPNRLYFGTSKIYQTVDGADSWLAISPDLSPTGGLSGGPATTVALAVGGGVNGSVVYAGTSDGLIFVATNVAPGSATFNRVSGQLPPRHPTQIVIDPADSTGNTAYVTYSGFSGFSGDQTGHIFKTLDGGVSWIDVSCHVANCGTPNPLTDLPNIPVNDLVIDPDIPGTLYAATDLGVFMTSDGGATWTTLNNNSLPNVAVLSLRLHEPSRTLRAATHGRGAWGLALTNFLFTGPHITDIAPTSANVGDPQTSLTVNGSGFTSNSKILFTLNGATDTLAPTFSSAVQLVTGIPGSDLQTSGDARVTVSDPGPPVATSNAMTFAVLAPVPSLLSCTSGTPAAPPASACSTPVQTPTPANQVTLTLNGAGFAANSQVKFDGSASGITVLAPSASCALPGCLQATLPANLLGPFGSTNDIAVLSPPPGGGTSLPLTFTVVAPPPANDNFANAISISLANNSFSDVKDSSGATTESTDPPPPCSQVPGIPFVTGLANTIWYKFTPSTGGTANLDTIGSNYDTVLSVWTGSAGSFVNVACNDDIVPGVNVQSQLLNVSLTAGTTYSIMVSSFGPPDPNPIALGGKSVFNFQFMPTPDFTITSTGTKTQTVTAGQTATFTNAITVAPQNGFSSAVNLSCSLPPSATGTTCAVNPNTLANGNGTASVAVTTTAHGFMPPTLPIGRFYSRPQWVPLFLLTLLLAVLMLRFARTRRQRRQRLAGALPFAVLVLFLVLQAMGCGGGRSSSGPPPPTGTPTGSYIVTVTGASGTLMHTTTLTLNVN